MQCKDWQQKNELPKLKTHKKLQQNIKAKMLCNVRQRKDKVACGFSQ